jgi:hypothetical protein
MWHLDKALYESMPIVSYVPFVLKREFPGLDIPLSEKASLVCLQFLQGTPFSGVEYIRRRMYELEEKHHLNITRRQSYTTDKCKPIFILPVFED